VNPPKCSDDDYINFVIASPREVTATETAKVQGDEEQAPAHDAFTRLLHRLEPDAATLWAEARTQVSLTQGILVLLWTDGDRHVPMDYRVFDKKQDALTKNDHFAAMVKAAHERGFAPECVAFDSWYSGLENLKLIRSFGWVWLEGFGLIRIFKVVATDGDVEVWATNKVEMDDLERVKWAGYSWAIEHYHRSIKQYCLIERAQVRSRRAWRNHIGLCLRAFLRLESHCYHRGVSWYEAKTSIIREAVRTYIANPLYSLIPTA
jgi:putative transposase